MLSLILPWYQKSFIKADLAVTLEGPKDRWEVALIGKNLNNALTTGTWVTRKAGLSAIKKCL